MDMNSGTCKSADAISCRDPYASSVENHDETNLMQVQLRTKLHHRLGREVRDPHQQESTLEPIYDDSKHHHRLLNKTWADAVQIFDGAGIPYFAYAGTILAVMRDGHFEKANDDIDLAFDLDYLVPLSEAFRQAGLVVKVGVSWPYNLMPHKPGESPEFGHSWTWGTLDLWGYYMSHDNSSVCVQTYMWHAPYDDVFPVRRVAPRHVAGGPAGPMPRKSEKVLADWYGNWREESSKHASPPRNCSLYTTVCGQGYRDRRPGPCTTTTIKYWEQIWTLATSS